MSIPITFEKRGQSVLPGGFGRLTFNLTFLALLCLLSFLALRTQSYRSVGHALHAVEIDDGQFIHGSQFSCIINGVGQSCSIDIGGRTLRIRTRQISPVPNTSGDCSATFGGRNVRCEPAFPTSSSWAHGVRLDNEMLSEAIADEWQHRFHWRMALIGMRELGALLLVIGGAIALPMLAVFVIPNGLARYKTQFSGLAITHKLPALLLVILLSIPTWFFLLWSMFHLGFAD